MKKILLSIVAAIMAVGAWADNCMDTIPAERCISNFNLDLHTNTLCFVDNYRTDVAFDREYFIMVYDRSSNDLENGCKFSTQIGIQGNLTYVYASENGGEARKCYSDSHLVLNSHGGLVCFSEDAVRNMIRSLYQNGSKEVIFIIDPYRDIKDDITGQTTLNSYYSGVKGSTGAEVWNLSYINYFTYSLPNPLTFELTSPASTVRYGEDIELKFFTLKQKGIEKTISNKGTRGTIPEFGWEQDPKTGAYRVYYVLSKGAQRKYQTVNENNMPQKQYFEFLGIK